MGSNKILINFRRLIRRLTCFFILLVAIFNLFACNSSEFFDGYEYFYYETQDLDDYWKLKEEKDFMFKIFPEELAEENVIQFSWLEYESYQASSYDGVLAMKYPDIEAFENAVSSVKGAIEEEYYFTQENDFFKQGDVCLFISYLKSSGYDGESRKYGGLSHHEAWLACWGYEEAHFSCWWDLILFLREEKMIVFNKLNYQYADVEAKGTEHYPYIQEILGIELKDFEEFDIWQ